MTLGSHQTSIGKTQVHITPRWIIEVLGPFDLDPAAADPRPWDCAAVNYTERDDGLRQPWFGRVWLNPAFDRYVVPFWIRKLARHGCGTALLHARTETDWFEPIWECHRVAGLDHPARSAARLHRARTGDAAATRHAVPRDPRDRADPFPSPRGRPPRRSAALATSTHINR
jgi:hypothetical protein